MKTFKRIVVSSVFLSAVLNGGCRRATEDIRVDAPKPAHISAGYKWTNSLGMVFARVPRKDSVIMSVWETRAGDFRKFVEATGYDAAPGFYYYEKLNWKTGDRSWAKPNFEQSDVHPVTGVSWNDAAAFCIWLSEYERRNGTIGLRQAYRLPTEREWAMAAGPDIGWPLPKNYGNYGPLMELDAFENTSPAGSFAPNENGFFDMAGNVWEFCLDFQGSQDNVRVIRGGSWQNWHSRFVGMHARGYCSPDIRITLYGFRIVLADDDQLAAAMEQRPPTMTPLPARMEDGREQP